jgi:hypothetical protein
MQFDLVRIPQVRRNLARKGDRAQRKLACPQCEEGDCPARRNASDLIDALGRGFCEALQS